jgi:hypothetical protein
MRAWQRRNMVIIGVAGLAMLGAGLFHGIRTSQGPARLATMATTITIDPNIGETFAPAPADAAPKLTALQAFAQQRRLRGRSVIPIPSGVTVKLGLLTILAGPTNPHTGKVVTKDGIAYAALNELAWGYSWHWCPMSRKPSGRPLQELGSLGLASPEIRAHPGIRYDCAVKHSPVGEPGMDLLDPFLHNREASKEALDNSGNRRKPEIQVVRQQPDGVRSRERPERRARHQMPPYCVSPCAFEARSEVRREMAADLTVLGEVRPLPAAQQRQSVMLESGPGKHVKERCVLVVPAGRLGHEHDVQIATICYLAQRRWKRFFGEHPASELRSFPQDVPLRDGEGQLDVALTRAR